MEKKLYFSFNFFFPFVYIYVYGDSLQKNLLLNHLKIGEYINEYNPDT